MEVINKDPFIACHDNFITDEECKFIIDVSKPHMKRAGVSDKKLDISKYKGRTNESHWIPLDRYELITNLAKRIATTIGLPSYTLFESVQVIHYTEGQEYKYHYDAYDKTNTEKYELYCGERGNRYMTVLSYINDVEQGGGTGFDSIEGRSDPLIVEPKKGRMVVFQNVHLDGSLHKQSRHAGLPVDSGEKWAFNLWVREKPIK
jgi:prolyl 4-hydroxylase